MENAALLVIDVQRELFRKKTPVYRSEELIGDINILIDAFHARSAPVLIVRHANDSWLKEGSEGWMPHEALHISDNDAHLTKYAGDAFQEPSIAATLKELNAQHIVVCGLVTHGCVRAACLGALKRGYAVTLAADAHSSFSEDAAELIEEWNRKLAWAGARVLPSAEIIKNLYPCNPSRQ